MAEAPPTSPVSDPGTGPLARLLGITRLSMTRGRATFEMTVRTEHMNPHGVVHGGVIGTLADYAMGAALTSELDAGTRCATLEMKINYVAAVSGGRLRAEAAVVHCGHRVAVIEARVTDDTGRLVAVGLGTFAIQRGVSPSAG